MFDEYVIEEYEHNDHLIKIVQDIDPESPREWDNVGTMVTWHRNYNLGDRGLNGDEEDALRRGGFPLLERYLRLAKKALVVLPLSIYEHSGMTMWVGEPLTDGYRSWDSSFIGFIYADKESVEKMGAPEDRVEKILRAEVKDFDTYLRGDIVGFRILKDGETIDSCYGFYSIEEAKQEAESYT